MQRARALESVLFFFSTLVVLALSSRQIGVVWDEAIYFRSSDRIADWFREGHPLAQPALERAWAYNSFQNPHPPFMKILSAASSHLLGRWLGFPLSYRFAHHLVVAACLALAYGLLRSKVTRAHATVAVAFAFLQPRVFGDLLLATTDGPVAAAWLVLPLLAWRSCSTTGARGKVVLRIGFFLVLGVAAATKFTGILAALPIFVYLLYRRSFREAAYLPAAVLFAIVFTVLVSPDKWRSPLEAALAYLSYPFHRAEIPILSMYLGRTYGFTLPWHYFLVISTVTVPLAVLVALPGLVRWRPRADAPAVAILFPLVFWMVLAHLPSTPKHDGVRQFLSFYPLLGVLASVGLWEIFPAADQPASSRSWLSHAAARLAVFAALVAALCRAHPHELSYYNALIGGIRGAEMRGMEMSYFFESIDPPFLAALDRALRPGLALKMIPPVGQLPVAYRAHGLLNTDFRWLPPDSLEKPDVLVVLRRRALVDDEWYKSLKAVYETKYDGVSLAKLVTIDR